MDDVLAPTNHIPSMALTHLIIADIIPFHALCLQCPEDIVYFLSTV